MNWCVIDGFILVSYKAEAKATRDKPTKFGQILGVSEYGRGVPVRYGEAERNERQRSWPNLGGLAKGP